MMAMLAMAAGMAAMRPSTPPASVSAPAVSCRDVCDAERLRPFFRRLAAVRRGGGPVRILQIGDSHTAGDQITGAWRTMLQTRYGNAGRGMLAPGLPYPGYITRGVTAAQSGGWTVHGIFGPSYSSGSGAPIGLTGYSLTAGAPGEWLALTSDTPDPAFDRFTVCGWAAPGAGTVRLEAGTASMAWSLDSIAPGPDCRTLDAPIPATRARVAVVSGPVTITSWTIDRQGSGVTLSNLGVVGSQFVHFERTDERLLAAELAIAKPDLIVVAFGTNEAFKPAFSAVDYEAALDRDIRRLQRLAPAASILMIGAPDSATRNVALQRDATGAVSTCADSTDWLPTAALAQVQAIQRSRAHALGIAFWDWSARMGGRCVANSLANRVPAQMRGDRVHFLRAGADIIAGLLQRDLDAAADRMLATTQTPH